MQPYIFSITIPWFDVTLEPRYYGLFYAISIMLGYKILFKEAQRRGLGLDDEQSMNCTLIIFVGALFGARFYEVFFEWDRHYQHMPWTEVFAVWHGGLAIHGAIIGGALTLILYAKWKQIRVLELMDIGVLCIMLGQAIGRWGNFTNGEAAGPVTDFWTGVVFPAGTPTFRYAQGAAVHPTMIYESIGNFVIFFLLWKLRLKSFRAGMLVAVYLIAYGTWRSVLTPLRMDNQYFTIGDYQILAAYNTSAIMILIAVLLIGKFRLWEKETTASPRPLKK